MNDNVVYKSIESEIGEIVLKKGSAIKRVVIVGCIIVAVIFIVFCVVQVYVLAVLAHIVLTGLMCAYLFLHVQRKIINFLRGFLVFGIGIGLGLATVFFVPINSGMADGLKMVLILLNFVDIIPLLIYYALITTCTIKSQHTFEIFGITLLVFCVIVGVGLYIISTSINMDNLFLYLKQSRVIA